MPLPAPALSASLQRLLQLQQEKQYPELAEALWRLLTQIFFDAYTALSAEEDKLFNLLGKLIVKIFADPQFHIPEKRVFDYINCTVLISNLVHRTEFKNTDLVIKLLLEQNAPIAKILPLYSFRNTVKLDIEQLFDRHPALVYGWMTMAVAHGHMSSVSEAADAWLKGMLRSSALRQRSDFLNQRYYYQLANCCTYIDHTQDKAVKTAVNKAFKALLPPLPPLGNYHPKKILIVSSLMVPGYAVYKSFSPLLEGLRGEYEVVTIAPPPQQAPKNPLELSEWQFNVVWKRIHQERPGMIIYPDISMDLVSVELSNVRLAPIQLTMYGHPASSFASEIDYFIASADHEVREDLEKNYSERTVLIPGLASISVYPDYALQHPPREAKYKDKIIITCAWGSLKLNSQLILMLKKALEQSTSNIIFRFTDIRGDYFSHFSVVEDLEAILGKEHVECLPPLPYKDFMGAIEAGDFSLESYPYGGFNRTVDTLFCGKPIVALEGRKIYNRFSAAILRQVGLTALVATNEQEFIDIIVRMADDATFRQEMTARVKALDLKKSVCNVEPMPYFKKAIDYLVENDKELRKQKSRAPIIIPANT